MKHFSLGAIVAIALVLIWWLAIMDLFGYGDGFDGRVPYQECVKRCEPLEVSRYLPACVCAPRR